MTASSKAKSKSAKQSSSSSGIWLIVGGIVLLALVALVLWLNNRSSAPATVSAPDVPAEWVNGATLGNPEAVVVLQAWEDFLCPACQQWSAQVKPTFVEEYVNSGKVRMEFHQFPLAQHNPGAIMSAQASECAADQNMFWPYHDKVFQAAAQRGQAGTTFDALVSYAGEVGVDENALRTCMNNLTHQNAIADSLTTAQQMGLNSTPSILVGGKLIENPFNYNALKAEIDAQLAAAN